MPLPRVSIIGRPNVGKSSLLNRLAKQRVSIVDPTPGVTRDRISVLLEIDAPLDTPKGTPSRLVELSDTGGWGVYTAEDGRYNEVGADLATLTPEIEHQIVSAIENSTLILLVMDAQVGITGLDQAIARLLRSRGVADRVVLIANKVDGESWIAEAQEATKLGFDTPYCVSAKSGYSIRGLLELLWTRLENEPEDSEGETEVRFAIVGQRNAGKSTLINALAGEERVIVSEIAGTTRDAVDVRFEMEGHRLVAIDTAGVRKRKSIADAIELYAYERMLQAIDRADVVMLLLDATRDVSGVDQKLSKVLQQQFKPTIIVVNKWDLVEGKSPADYLDYLTQELRGLDYAPIVFISASEGEGIDDMVAMALNLHRQAGHRVATSDLNRVISDILDRRGPSSRLGTQAKLLYVSQVATHPPTIAMVVNVPDLFKGQYERYLMNRLREELPFSEVPIRLLFRKRQRMALGELKSRGRGDPEEGLD